MKTQRLRNVAELLIVLFAASLLSVQGAKHVIGVLAAARTLPGTAYAAGELAGQLIGAVYPLLLGIGLVIIVYRRGFIARARMRVA